MTIPISFCFGFKNAQAIERKLLMLHRNQQREQILLDDGPYGSEWSPENHPPPPSLLLIDKAIFTNILSF